MSDQPTLEETLLRKAESIGAQPEPKFNATPLLSPMSAANAATMLEAVGSGEVPSLFNLLKHYKNSIGDAILGAGIRQGRDYIEQETGARLPRTVPEAWHLLMDRDQKMIDAQPKAGTYPIRIPKLNK